MKKYRITYAQGESYVQAEEDGRLKYKDFKAESYNGALDLLAASLSLDCMSIEDKIDIGKITLLDAGHQGQQDG